MNQQQRIEQAITSATGATAKFAKSQAVAGGCISNGQIVTLQDARVFFVKTHHNPPDGMFSAEYRALELLAAAAKIRVPKPIVAGADFIVTEAFEQGRPRTDWQERIGRQLAELHFATRQEGFGFEVDNYLGTAPQPNGWLDDWVSFWRERRLGWQFQLFAQQTDKDDPLLTLGNRLLDKLEDLLNQPDEPAVLLHGDLWSGNASADENGEPVIFDPASYYGRREAEIGMMRLFGGFNARCEAAYQEVWPLAPDADRRIACYRLYHQLNHLNLFGNSYYDSCLTTMSCLTSSKQLM